MTYTIHWLNKHGMVDSLNVTAETIEGIQEKAKLELSKRGIDPEKDTVWSTEVK